MKCEVCSEVGEKLYELLLESSHPLCQKCYKTTTGILEDTFYAIRPSLKAIKENNQRKEATQDRPTN